MQFGVNNKKKIR